MINKLIKNQIFEKFKEFKSFFTLIFLISLSVMIINFHEKFKKEQTNNLKNIYDNTYFQKTLLSFSKSLNPRFEKVTHNVSAGETFDKILNNTEIDKSEKKKILDYIVNNNLKFNIYENQKIIIEIDNLKKKNITKISIPINKKKDLVIINNGANSYTSEVLTKELRLVSVYKENYIKNSLYTSAIEKKNKSKCYNTICTNIWI